MNRHNHHDRSRGTPTTCKLSMAALCMGLPLIGCGTTVIELELPDEQDDGGDSTAGDDEGDSTAGDGGSGEDGPAAADCEALEVAASALLENNCTGCHSGEDAKAGFDYVADLGRLVGTGKIVPGDAAGSPLWQRIDGGQMPPPAAASRPSAAQIDDFAAWIDSCAPEGACAHDDHISLEQMLDYMRTDIGDTSVIASDERQFYRYFTLTHLYNAGSCSEDLAGHRWALTKAINSLSLETKIVAPVAIDPEKTIYRIDLRDYGWDAALWDSMVLQNPYAVEYLRDEATDLKGFTQTAVPFQGGDWFVSTASRPPLYHEILRIPGNRAELEAQLGIQVQTNIDLEEVERSGFLDSGVSVNNRLIERHEFADASNRTYWLSYDFASNGGTGNIFAFPLDFQEAGNEIIFSLPNGLHAYMITDAFGNRLDEAPDDIVTDPAQPDQNVTNGLSCMGCHTAGIIARADELRDHVINSFEFDDFTKEKVNKLHPAGDAFEGLQTLDSDRYLDAVAQTGSPTDLEWEPINMVFQEFDGDVDLHRVAAELGITVEELSNQIGGLGPDLQTLLTSTVKREVFTINFAQSICDLNIGRTAACGGPGAP
jgi:hypothetical protein